MHCRKRVYLSSLFIKKEEFIINYVSVSVCSPVIIFKAIYEFVRNFVRNTTPRGHLTYFSISYHKYHLYNTLRSNRTGLTTMPLISVKCCTEAYNLTNMFVKCARNLFMW
jgi:hypothetical protein